MTAILQFKKISFALNVVVASIGLLVLIGWVADITVFKSILPSWVSMKANEAVCFILAAMIQIIVSRENVKTLSKRISSVFSFFIFLMGLLTLIQYVFNYNIGIDEFLFMDDGGAYEGLFFDGRMPIFTCLFFIVVGFTTIPEINKRIEPLHLQLSCLFGGVISVVTLIGYIFNTHQLFGTPLFTFMSFHSALCFLLLIFAFMFSNLEYGIIKLAGSNTVGGRLIRRKIPLYILIFIVLGWLRVEGQQAGLYDSEFGTAIMVVIMIFLFSALLIISGGELSIAESGNSKANEGLEIAEKLAGLGSWEVYVKGDKRVRKWSKQMFRLMELEQSDEPPSFAEYIKMLHPDDRASVRDLYIKMSEGIVPENLIYRTNPKIMPLKYLWPTLEIKKSANGKGIRYYGSVQDITERVLADEALKENELRLQTILETVPECVKIIDTEGNLTYINQAGIDLLEAENYEMVKDRKSLDVIHGQYQNDFLQLLTNVFSGHSGTMEYEITGFKQSHRWMETNMVPMKDQNEKIYSVLAVTRDITERKMTDSELKSSREQLRQLASNLQNIREEDRKRLGREIHDELGQWLTALKMEAFQLSKHKLEDLDSALEEMISHIDTCIKSSRRICNELRPTLIDHLGLIAALEWQSEEFEKRNNIKSNFVSNVSEIELEPDFAIGLFRIFQESMTNIVRHAKATNVESSLHYENNEIIMKIMDDGIGFNESVIENGKTLGLIGMKERTLLMDGIFKVKSEPRKGTSICITIPLVVV